MRKKYKNIFTNSSNTSELIFKSELEISKIEDEIIDKAFVLNNCLDINSESNSAEITHTMFTVKNVAKDDSCNILLNEIKKQLEKEESLVDIVLELAAREVLKELFSDLFVSISSLLIKIQDLIIVKKKLIKFLKIELSRYFTLDLRLIYRNIIRFLFKNLNDNSGGDGLVVYNLIKQFEVVNLKEILYERKSTINKGYQPCYQFQNE